MFTKEVEYKGRTYNVTVDVAKDTRKLFINNEEIKPMVKRFRNMRNCFAKRAVLDDDEVVVIVYGKYVSIEECPHNQINHYLNARFAPPMGSNFLFALLSILFYCPMMGAAGFLAENSYVVWALPYLPLLWLGVNVLTYIAHHPKYSQLKCFLMWLAGAILLNVIAFGYFAILANTIIKPA